MHQLDDKTALVTGGTSGIGLATAQRLAAEGAHVFITGRRAHAVDDAVASIGDAATGVVGDVTDPADLERIAEAITSRGRGLDIVFTNAGGGEFATLEDETRDHLFDILTRNVGGTVFTVQAVLPLLNEGASVVLAGSTAASEGVPAFGAYAASKAAVRSLGRTWAAELAGRGIRVNTVVPGPTETPGLTGLVPDEQKQGFLDELGSALPVGRVGRPDEIAGVVAFLGSDASSFMTGSEVFVDGGSIQV